MVPSVEADTADNYNTTLPATENQVEPGKSEAVESFSSF